MNVVLLKTPGSVRRNFGTIDVCVSEAEIAAAATPNAVANVDR
ncbi:MAG TPA: hypothetical protein VFP64_18390 [Pyrinomonadaceae bacterium]|nr:hypothetical protein [Pyrinomonadaceae bacterium]